MNRILGISDDEQSNVTLANGAPEPTCQFCVHWRRMPTNPNAVNEIRGECRALPPQVTVVQSQLGMGQIAQFPVLKPDFPACGMFITPEQAEEAQRRAGL